MQAERHARCRAAIGEIGRIIRAADVDVLVIVSSDHKEIYGDELLPQFAVYWGETMRHEPYTAGAARLDAAGPGGRGGREPARSSRRSGRGTRRSACT